MITPNNKLVRDNIPDIIIKNGGTPKTRVLDSDEYRDELRKKLSEEVDEYLKEPSLEELADISEVIHALAIFDGDSPDALERKRAEKADERGGFTGRIYLIETETPDA